MARDLLQRMQTRKGKIGGLLTLGGLALVGSAAIVHRQAAQAEKANPARGSFVTSNGVRLHYIERGRGRPIVFLHGNGMTVDDMRISGIMDTAADHSFAPYRSIVRDLGIVNARAGLHGLLPHRLRYCPTPSNFSASIGRLSWAIRLGPWWRWHWLSIILTTSRAWSWLPATTFRKPVPILLCFHRLRFRWLVIFFVTRSLP